MGKPHQVFLDDSDVKVRKRTLGSETSQYQEEKRQIMHFLSSGERKGKSPNQSSNTSGL